MFNRKKKRGQRRSTKKAALTTFEWENNGVNNVLPEKVALSPVNRKISRVNAVFSKKTSRVNGVNGV